MPELNWLINDPAPATLAQEFDPPAPSWPTETYWGPMTLAFNPAQETSGSSQPPRTLHLARIRRAA